MLKFFEFFNKFEVFSFKNWRYNFFHKTVSFQNRMEKLFIFIHFCLTCILNMLHPDYKNLNERNILQPCCFPDFTHSRVFFESCLLLMEIF